MTFVDWVREVYAAAIVEREAAEANGETGNFADAAFLALFTPETHDLLLQSRGRAMPVSEPDGPILHYLFGWGALPFRKIVLRSVEKRSWLQSWLLGFGDGAVVAIDIAGNPRELTVEGGFDAGAGGWRISDIDYGSGGPDRHLVARLRRMMEWPKR